MFDFLGRLVGRSVGLLVSLYFCCLFACFSFLFFFFVCLPVGQFVALLVFMYLLICLGIIDLFLANK